MNTGYYIFCGGGTHFHYDTLEEAHKAMQTIFEQEKEQLKLRNWDEVKAEYDEKGNTTEVKCFWGCNWKRYRIYPECA